MTVLRRVGMEIAIWAILAVTFWQWRGWFMGAIATDDVIIAASGLRLHAEPGNFLPLDLGLASTGSAHFLPLGGVLTGTFLWLALTLYEHTSLSLPESWGLLSWLSMLLCWRMVSRFIIRMTGTARVLTATLSVGALGSLGLQIPGDFNLNAVLSFPVAGWLTTAIAVWAVTAVFKRQDQISAPFLLALSAAAIMVYELLIFPILFAALLSSISNRLEFRRSLFLLASSCVALLIPLAHRVYYAFSSPAAEYVGTKLNASGTFVEGAWTGVMSSASAFPLGQLASAARLGTIEVPDISFRTLALVCATCVLLLRGFEPEVGFSRFRMGSVVLGVSAVVAGAVLGATAKYSAYFSAELGRTYLQFPLAVVAVVLAVFNLLIWSQGTKARQFCAAGLLLLVGLIHQSSNSLVAEKFQDHWAWAEASLEDVSSETDDVVLCRHYRSIASQPMPDVFSSQLISYLDQFRQAQFGKGMCPSFDISRITAFKIAGDVDEPEHHDSGSWWWLTGDTFEIEVTFLDEPPESIGIPVGSSPCNSPLAFRFGMTEQQVVESDSRPTVLHVPLDVVDHDERGFWRTRVDGRVSGWACLLDGEQRSLVAPIFFPT